MYKEAAGTVISVKKQWWLKVNAKRVRLHAMDGAMFPHIEIKLDENCKEPKIIVVTNKMTDEINEIMKRLSDEQPKMIAGFKDDK